MPHPAGAVFSHETLDYFRELEYYINMYVCADKNNGGHMRPFELRAPVKDYIWGGTRLRDEFGKESCLERLAESWELSCHQDGESVIASGEYQGMTLAEFLRMCPEAAGKCCKDGEGLPVLVKLIDARENLSVQVHPDDSYARQHEGDSGKTEMWYIVDCDEGAELIYGFREKMSKESFRRAIEDNTLMDFVNRVPVKKGDVFFITPGTLHAIGKGILIAEIQQSSNVTYRVYDYGRLGKDGKPRELHIEKALDVTVPDVPAYKAENHLKNACGRELDVIRSCDYFHVLKLECKGSYKLKQDSNSFMHLLVIDGEGTVGYEGGNLPIRKGSSVFVPAGDEALDIKGKCSIIITKKIQEEKT